MHVAYIHQHFQTPQDRGGTRSYEMARRLIAGGHRVTMISGAMEGVADRLQLKDRIACVKVDGIDVAYVNEPYENKMDFWQRVRVFRRFAKEAEQLAVEAKPDLVFATSTPLTVGDPGRKAAARLGVPFVFEVRDLWPELPIAMGIIRNPVLKWYLRRMERRIYRAASHCIALSPGMKEGIVETGFPEDRVTIIPNAADVDLFSPDNVVPRDKWIGDPNSCRFVFSGAHGMANGVDAMLAAAAELKRRGESGIQFVSIGYGKLRDQLIEQSLAMKLDDYILWADPIPKAELARHLPSFDVGLMMLRNVPAFYRGTSPNKFFDYVASGLPVLNNYPGWLAGMIEENNFGKVVPPDDPVAFAEACLWFRDHIEDRKLMGQRARQFAETEHSRDKCGDLFVSTLESVANSTKK